MAPRHIYNPAMLTGRGRFPVQVSSCAMALLGRPAKLLNTTMFTVLQEVRGTSEIHKEKLREYLYTMTSFSGRL